MSQSKELDHHLTLTEGKLDELKLHFQAGLISLDDDQYQDLTELLKKTHLYLTKAKAMQSTLRGKAKLEYDAATLKTLVNHINELQGLRHSEFQTGTALTRANLFWYTLKEFKTLIQELRKVKKNPRKSRGPCRNRSSILKEYICL